MRAVRLHDQGDMRMEEVPRPTPGPGEVVIATAFSGVCGTDLHVFDDPGSTGVDGRFTPHPLTGARFPQVIGHEYSGIVAEVGPGVDAALVGTRVAVFPLTSCQTCATCVAGHPNDCALSAFRGLSHEGGGMAEFSAVSESQLVRLPEQVSLLQGALTEPFAVASHAIDRADVEPTDRVLVTGGGPIGVALYRSLLHRGVRNIVVSEPRAGRRAYFERDGAVVVDPHRGEDAMEGDIGQAGFDVAFEASGSPAGFDSALRLLAVRGRLVMVATYSAPIALDTGRMIRSECDLVSCRAYLRRDFESALAVLVEMTDFEWLDVVPLGALALTYPRIRDGVAGKVVVDIRAP